MAAASRAEQEMSAMSEERRLRYDDKNFFILG